MPEGTAAKSGGITVGLRVDVDTFRGTRLGVPRLVEILARHDIRAGFFFSVGPDNMGRHLFRLLKPRFFWKMLRTRAANLYGPGIIFCGTLGPGKKIGKGNEQVIRDCAAAGHEIGLHAWDHHLWQAKGDTMSVQRAERQTRLGYDELTRILGRLPDCSAFPAWKCQEAFLPFKDSIGFRYNSDCRGRGIFFPVVAGRRLATPQIALNLPTYDELIGSGGVTDANYNQTLLSLIDDRGPNLLTIHAEVEGISRDALFEEFLRMAAERRIRFVPPGELLPGDLDTLPTGRIEQKTIPGREGKLAVCRLEA